MKELGCNTWASWLLDNLKNFVLLIEIVTQSFYVVIARKNVIRLARLRIRTYVANQFCCFTVHIHAGSYPLYMLQSSHWIDLNVTKYTFEWTNYPITNQNVCKTRYESMCNNSQFLTNCFLDVLTIDSDYLNWTILNNFWNGFIQIILVKLDVIDFQKLFDIICWALILKCFIGSSSKWICKLTISWKFYEKFSIILK